MARKMDNQNYFALLHYFADLNIPETNYATN